MGENCHKTADPDADLAIKQWLGRLRDKAEPYERFIMLGGMIILIFLVVFLGYARGGLDTCNDLGGRFDSKLDCHLGCYEPDKVMRQPRSTDAVGQRFVVPELDEIINGT
jgi:hypothetical protein|tara:strand:+ start:2145 stop:2474 length:330 start_codon:yes stop_codon:yes gene_type:complete